MTTHAEVADVIEEDDPGGAGWIDGIGEQSADHDVGTARLVDHGGAERVEAIAEEKTALSHRTGAEVGTTTDNDPRRLAASVSVENVDALVGNEEDLQKGLGIPGPEVAGKSKLDPTVFFAMMDNVVRKLPHVKVVATTLREVHSTNRHSWSAVAWIDGKTYTAPTAELDVLDRVGGGDGFASGFIYGLLTGESPEESVKLGWAHGALLTTFPGDTTMATVDQVRAFAKGGSARIQR